MNILSIATMEALRRQPPAPEPGIRSGTALSERGMRVLRLKRGEQTELNDEQAHFLSVARGAVELTQGSDKVCLSPAGVDTPYAVRRGYGVTTLIAQESSVVYCATGADVTDTLAPWSLLSESAGRRNSRSFNECRLARLRRSNAFRRAPLECVEAALARMSERHVVAGEEILRQGDPACDFFVIWKGCAEVWQIGLDDDAPKKVATLEQGDAFGEEALVTGGRRNATVRMVSDGVLLVLSRSDFQRLLASPLIQEVDASMAKVMADSGARWIDVRYEEEYEESHIPGAVLIPLHDLREMAPLLLDHKQHYIVYCRSGRRSRVGALLLAQRGYQALSMRGGLMAWPHEVRALS